MKENITRLSNLIAKLITDIEDEFEKLYLSDQKNKIKLQKVITDTLAKLVELIVKLHKINQEDGQDQVSISSEDLLIIENFLQSHTHSITELEESVDGKKS